jgi:hypothetical protein
MVLDPEMSDSPSLSFRGADRRRAISTGAIW